MLTFVLRSVVFYILAKPKEAAPAAKAKEPAAPKAKEAAPAAPKAKEAAPPKAKEAVKPKESKPAAPKPVKTKDGKSKESVPAKAKEKALKAKRAVQKGVHDKRARKVRTTVHFRRPRTLRTPRAPKYPRRSVPRRQWYYIYTDYNLLLLVTGQILLFSNYMFEIWKKYEAFVSLFSIAMLVL